MRSSNNPESDGPSETSSPHCAAHVSVSDNASETTGDTEVTATTASNANDGDNKLSEETNIPEPEPLLKRVIGFAIRTFTAAAVTTLTLRGLSVLRPMLVPYQPPGQRVSRKSPFSLRSFWPFLSNLCTAATVIFSDYILFGTRAHPGGPRRVGARSMAQSFKAKAKNRKSNTIPTFRPPKGPSSSSSAALAAVTPSISSHYHSHLNALARQHGIDNAVVSLFADLLRTTTPAPQSTPDNTLYSAAQICEYVDKLGLHPTAAHCIKTAFPHPQRLYTLQGLQEAFHRHKQRPFVFLGGVCGSSTWRQDAIQLLDAAGVSYYNPQVAEWREELVAVEALMKAWCPAVLFVIDGTTRAVASLVEASAMCAEGRRAVLVLGEVDCGSCVDADGAIGKGQCQDLNRGRRYLRDVANQHDVVVKRDVNEATETIISMFVDYYNKNNVD